MVRDRPVTIGVASRVLGIPAWRLRAWEKAGLIATERTTSGYRLYSMRDLEKARAVAQELDGGERLAALSLAHAVPEGDSSGGTDASVPVEAGNQRQLAILRRLSHAIRHTDSRPALVAFALESALEATDAVVGALSSADFTRQQYVLLSSIGLSQRYTRGVDSWKLHEGLAGRAFGLREPIIIDDLQVDRHVAREFVRAEGLRGYICVPLLRGQRRLGILEVFSRTAGRFGNADVAALEMVAAAISPLLEGAELDRQLASLQEERTRSMREWSNQLLSAHDRERSAIAARIREVSAGLERREMTMAEAGASVAAVADDLSSGRAARIDLQPLIESNVVGRLSQLNGIDISLKLEDWPPTLPTALTSRIYLLILALTEEAAALARTRVELTMSSTLSELTISVADDRESVPGSSEAAASAQVVGAIRNLGGRLAPGSAARGAMVGVVVIVPRGEQDARGDALTLRERGVLEALRMGATNREIAFELSISSKTLQNHLTALYRKLGVSSRAEAIRYGDEASRESRTDS